MDLQGKRIQTLGANLPSPPRPDRYLNAAWSVRREGVSIRFASSDRGPVFSRGRFYADDTQTIAGCGTNLYALAASRVVVVRAPQEPVRVQAVVRLPADAGKQDLVLVSRGPDLFLRNLRSTAACRLNVRAATPQWLSARCPDDTVRVSNFAEWERDSASGEYFPFLRLHPGSRLLETNFWANGAFRWDIVTAAACVDSNELLCATEAGNLRVNIGAQPGLGDAWLWQEVRGNRIEPARAESGAFMGLLVFGGDAGEQATLVRSGDDTRKGLATELARDLYCRDPVVTLKVAGAMKDGRSPPGFQQDWVRRKDRGDGPALSVDDPSVLAGRLFPDGRFFFDQVKDICQPGNARGNEEWNAVSGANPGWWVSLALKTNPVERIEMTGLLPLPRPIDAVRFSGDSLIACWQEQDVAHYQCLARATEGIQLVPCAAEARAAFRDGDAVCLDLARLSWSRSDRYSGISAPLFVARVGSNILPPEAPLFVSIGEDSRRMLAVDFIYSLAVDRERGRLALGTAAGVWTAPLTPDTKGIEFLNHPEGGLQIDWLIPPAAAGWQSTHVSPSPRQVIKPPYRLAFIGEKLWVRNADTVSQGVPPPIVSLKDGDLLIGEQDLSWHGRKYSRSNNAWWMGRHTLSGLRDVTADAADAGVIWLCGSNGVFRVFAPQL